MQEIKDTSKKKSFYAQEQERDDVKIKRKDFIDAVSEIDPKKLNDNNFMIYAPPLRMKKH